MQSVTNVTTNDVIDQLETELSAAQAEWKAAREVLTEKTKARAKVRHRLNMFYAALGRAQNAALGKGCCE